MADRDPVTPHPEDLPWNDVPADNDIVLGSQEPDPAEVVGEEGEEVDISYPGVRDPDEYHRDTLDERLAEEEPDRVAHAQAEAVPDLVASEGGSDDLFTERSEADQAEPAVGDGEAAEDAAIHVRDQGRA